MHNPSSYVFLWATAVERQGSRSLDHKQPSTYRLVDAMLFAAALRNLLRAVDYARSRGPKPTKLQITAALARFEQRVPNAIRVRDALEHFDEYDQGVGDHQKRSAAKQRTMAMSAQPWPFRIRWVNNRAGVLEVGPGISLTICNARSAARDLHMAFERAWLRGDKAA